MSSIIAKFSAESTTSWKYPSLAYCAGEKSDGRSEVTPIKRYWNCTTAKKVSSAASEIVIVRIMVVTAGSSFLFAAFFSFVFLAVIRKKNPKITIARKAASMVLSTNIPMLVSPNMFDSFTPEHFICAQHYGDDYYKQSGCDADADKYM